MLHTSKTILKPCTFFQFGKVPCNLFVTPSYVSTWTNFSSKKHTNLSTMSLRFFVLLFCTFKSIEALVKCNGIVKKLQICSLDDTYDHGRFIQGLLKSSRNKKDLNDITAATFLVSFSQLPAAKKHQKAGSCEVIKVLLIL